MKATTNRIRVMRMMFNKESRKAGKKAHVLAFLRFFLRSCFPHSNCDLTNAH